MGDSEAEIRTRYRGHFDTIAEDYDRHRWTYSPELIDAVLAAAGLVPGDRVLEVGCGTGQLTAALAARGLVVEALDPGENMLALARRRLADHPETVFHHAPLESADLPTATYRAVFSASAFHWVDPAMSWARAAEVLAPGGTLTLITYTAIDDPEFAAVDREMFDVLARVAPELGALWERPRTREALLAGAAQRAANVSAVWSWIGRYALERPEAGDLFAPAVTDSRRIVREMTGEQLNALIRTTSFHDRLSADQQQALEAENVRIAQRRGGHIRGCDLHVAVSARRAPVAAG